MLPLQQTHSECCFVLQAGLGPSCSTHLHHPCESHDSSAGS